MKWQPRWVHCPVRSEGWWCTRCLGVNSSVGTESICPESFSRWGWIPWGSGRDGIQWRWPGERPRGPARCYGWRRWSAHWSASQALQWCTSRHKSSLGISVLLWVFFCDRTAYWSIFLPQAACSPLRHWWHRCKSDRACPAAGEWCQRTRWVRWAATGVLNQHYQPQLASRSPYTQSAPWEDRSIILWFLRLKLRRTVGPSVLGLFLQTGSGSFNNSILDKETLEASERNFKRYNFSCMHTFWQVFHKGPKPIRNLHIILTLFWVY